MPVTFGFKVNPAMVTFSSLNKRMLCYSLWLLFTVVVIVV